MNFYKTIPSVLLLTICSLLLFGQNTEFNQNQLLGKWVDISDKRFYLVFNDSTLTEYTSYAEPEVFSYKIVRNKLEKKSKRDRSTFTYNIVELTERTLILKYIETKTYRKELGTIAKILHSHETKKLIKRQPFLEKAEAIDKNKNLASNSESGSFDQGAGSYEKTSYFIDTLVSKITITYIFKTEGKKAVYSYYYSDNKLFFYSAKITAYDKEKKSEHIQCIKTLCFDNNERVDETHQAQCNERLSKKEVKEVSYMAARELDKALISLRLMKANGNKFPLEYYQKK